MALEDWLSSAVKMSETVQLPNRSMQSHCGLETTMMMDKQKVSLLMQILCSPLCSPDT